MFERLKAFAKARKGNMNVLAQVALGIGVFIVVIVLVYKLVGAIQETNTVNDSAYNATNTLTGTNGLGLVVSLAPVVIIVLIFAAILGLLYYFGGFGKK